MKNNKFQIIGVFLLALLCNACDSKAVAENFIHIKPLHPNDYSLYRVSDDLIVHIPTPYTQFWNKPDKVLPLPKDLTRFPKKQLSFHFFMPNFTGYSEKNIFDEFDENRIDVVYVQYAGMGQEQPNTPGFFPPNMLKNITSGVAAIDPTKSVLKNGLQCFEQRPFDESKQYCYGMRDADKKEYILLDTMIPPYADWIKYPQMQARYFSPQYGGIEILWRTNMKHFDKWQDIDSQIWKFIAAWNVAPKQPN